MPARGRYLVWFFTIPKLPEPNPYLIQRCPEIDQLWLIYGYQTSGFSCQVKHVLMLNEQLFDLGWVGRLLGIIT